MPHPAPEIFLPENIFLESVYSYTLLRFYPYTLIPLYFYTLIPLYPCTLIPLYPYTLIPLYPYTLNYSYTLYTHRPVYPYILICWILCCRFGVFVGPFCVCVLV